MKPQVFIKALFGLAALLSGAGVAAQGTPAERIWLQEHNAARAQFGSAPVAWNPRLAKEARGWARQLARSDQLRHSSREERGGAGENLWMGTTGYFAPAQMIASLVDERRDFVPGRFPEVSRTGQWADVGHYTQIVWPQTREVGCAMAPGARFDVLVCRYWPAGNRIGEAIAPRSQNQSR